MTGFEQGFADTERAASATIKSAGDVTRAARALERAARTGSINAMRRAQSDLGAAVQVLQQEAANAGNVWPFHPNDEEAYLREHFTGELRAVAAEQGLNIHQRDEQLIAHPSVVRVLPGNRAVRIDRKQVSTIRPRYLTSLLLANQAKPARFNGAAILESTYNAYRMLIGGHSPLNHLERGQQGQPVPVARVYEAMTLMPGQAREYSRTDFARDLYRLDTDGPQTTRIGSRLNFHGGRQSNVAFVAPDGHLITYHSISFSEASNG